MKKTLIFCLAAALLVSFGCGEKQQEDTRAAKEEVRTARVASLIDPVDDKPLENFETSQWSYVYKDVEYRFNSEKNYKAFKEDPEKYLGD